MANASDIFKDLRAFAAEIGDSKTAAAGDPPTSHPTGSADDGTVSMSEGPLSKEVSTLLKAQQPASVDGQTTSSTPDQESLQYNIGIDQSGTGNDPSAEDDYKDRPYDPGTSTPITTDGGEKYSSWTRTQLVSDCEKRANSLLATIAVGNARGPSPVAAAPVAATLAAAAGYKLASASSVAANDLAFGTIRDTVLEAQLSGQLTHDFLTNWEQKKAEEAEDDAPPSDDAPEDPSAEAPSGADPALPLPGMGGPPGLGAGGPPPGMGDPSMGGPPPGMGDPSMGGPPPGMGDPSMGGPPGAGGDPGQVGHEEAAHELVAALIEMGISPEDLIAAASQPKAAGDMSRTIKHAAAVAQTHLWRHAGRFDNSPPKTARANEIRNKMREFLKEVVS